LQGTRQNLGDILDGETLLRVHSLDAVLEHRDAEGTGRRHRVRASRERLLHARVVDALAGVLLHPDAPTTAAAAERAVAVATHLGDLASVDDVQDAPWLVVDAVPAPDEAGVVVGQLALVEARRELQLPRGDQPVDELGMVDDLVIAAKLR